MLNLIGVARASGSAIDLSSPPPIGDVAPNTGAFTTLSATSVISLPSQSANLVFASPSDSAGVPSFRAITALDITTALTTPPAIGGTTPAAGAFTTLSGIVSDSATNTTTNIVTVGHNSSGTPAASFGAGLLYQLETTTTENTAAARVRALWTTATHASRVSNLVLSVYNVASEVDVLTLHANGINVLQAGANYTGEPNVSINTIRLSADGSNVLSVRTNTGAVTATLQTANLRVTSLRTVGNGVLLASTAEILSNTKAVVAFNTSTVSTIGFLVATPATDIPNLVTRAITSQTANLFEAQTSGGAIIAAIGVAGATVFNEQGSDADFRIEGDTDANLFFADASVDRVGIGNSSPNNKLDVTGTIQADGLRLDLTPTAETPVMTHTITISVNGTDYKIPIVAA